MRKAEKRRLAIETIHELRRRGWTKGKLVQTFEWEGENCVRVDAGVGSVCLVGAMSSAYNPFHPRMPGYNDGPYVDKDFQQFMLAVVEEILNLDLRVGEFSVPSTTVVNFNDIFANSVDDIIDLLQRVADKHAPKPRVKKTP